MESLLDLIAELNQKRLNSHRSYNPREYVSAWLENDILLDKDSIAKALVVILRTHGCSWSRTTGSSTSAPATPGGCTMCGYLNDCIPSTTQIKPEDIIFQFESVLEKFRDKKFEIIKIYTSGSYLDDNEVGAKVQLRILKMINDLNIQKVIVETRPEFITERKLKELISSFSGKLQLAIGLESCNDKILNYSINKGFTFKDYCTAVDIVKGSDASIKTYLLLKPPFLTEQDAISDVLHSIQKLRDGGLTNCISINPVHIQKFTLIERLYNHNDYRPPWLWSVVEVLSQGAKLLEDTGIRLLSQPTAGGLRNGPHNCGECDSQVLKTIDKFSLKNDTSLFQELNCTCRDKWRDILDLENIVKSNLEPAQVLEK